jgi:hypothetical protein
MPWTPTESEANAALALLADLLTVPEDEQLNVLALLANLWCYHQKVKREAGA